MAKITSGIEETTPPLPVKSGSNVSFDVLPLYQQKLIASSSTGRRRCDLVAHVTHSSRGLMAAPLAALSQNVFTGPRVVLMPDYNRACPACGLAATSSTDMLPATRYSLPTTRLPLISCKNITQ